MRTLLRKELRNYICLDVLLIVIINFVIVPGLTYNDIFLNVISLILLIILSLLTIEYHRFRIAEKRQILLAHKLTGEDIDTIVSQKNKNKVKSSLK